MNSDVASNLLCKYALACKLTLQKSREASPRRQHLPKVPRLLLTSHSIAAKSLLGQHTKSTWCTPAWTTAHWWRDMPACMLFSGAVKQITHLHKLSSFGCWSLCKLSHYLANFPHHNSQHNTAGGHVKETENLGWYPSAVTLHINCQTLSIEVFMWY